ncbi:hypothetical protein EDC01DRAFT_718317 [Geopyxis carbonaria]|nr:hypothetical protein EDC01DRAFT_718317 [Geopyxis carbonaria]
MGELETDGDSSNHGSSDATRERHAKGRWWSRDRYIGALLFNLGTFLLPAVYGTLSKLWVAGINSDLVATTDTYTYIGVVVEVINEGLPRAAYKVIGDRSRRSWSSRLGISYTLIIFQTLLGLILSFIIFGAAAKMTKAFVPVETRNESLQYVRIASFQCLFSALDISVSLCTRTLDRPDVPLTISAVKTTVNILLDLLFLSSFRVKHVDVDVNTQAWIRLCCDAAGSLTGLFYFLRIAAKTPANTEKRPSLHYLGILARPGSYTFVESAIRNALYLWLVSGIVKLGKDWATAWGVFNTIRWGLVMVPVSALEATASTFVGHAWGAWKASCPPGGRPATKAEILIITRPALLAALISLPIEVPLCLLMTFVTARPFAYYLSGSAAVADITAYMWRTIDWCYIFYGVSTQLASILLATRLRWYLAQSLGANVLYVLPWAIAVSRTRVKAGDEWRIYALVFGGSMVVSFGIVCVTLTAWGWRLMRGGRWRALNV